MATPHQQQVGLSQSIFQQPDDVTACWLLRCQDALAGWSPSGSTPLPGRTLHHRKARLALDSIVVWQGMLRTAPPPAREPQWMQQLQRLGQLVLPSLTEFLALAAPLTPQKWLASAQSLQNRGAKPFPLLYARVLLKLDDMELFAAAWNAHHSTTWPWMDGLLSCHSWLHQNQHKYKPLLPMIRALCSTLRPSYGLQDTELPGPNPEEQQLVLTAYKFHSLYLALQPQTYAKES